MLRLQSFFHLKTCLLTILFILIMVVGGIKCMTGVIAETKKLHEMVYDRHTLHIAISVCTKTLVDKVNRNVVWYLPTDHKPQ